MSLCVSVLSVNCLAHVLFLFFFLCILQTISLTSPCQCRCKARPLAVAAVSMALWVPTATQNTTYSLTRGKALAPRICSNLPVLTTWGVSETTYWDFASDWDRMALRKLFPFKILFYKLLEQWNNVFLQRNPAAGAEAQIMWNDVNERVHLCVQIAGGLIALTPSSAAFYNTNLTSPDNFTSFSWWLCTHQSSTNVHTCMHVTQRWLMLLLHFPLHTE